MDEVSVIGVDLAKAVFQLHGATAAGAPVFRKKLSRAQFRAFMAKRPPCRVAMEAPRPITGVARWRRSGTRSG